MSTYKESDRQNYTILLSDKLVDYKTLVYFSLIVNMFI